MQPARFGAPILRGFGMAQTGRRPRAIDSSGDPDTLASRRNLAIACRDAGRTAEAIRPLKRTLPATSSDDGG